MGRIENKFKQLRSKGKKAFVAYLTAGDPDLATTAGLICALEKGGVDIVEIGVPFSDPTADGPTIQAASLRALQTGVSLEGILTMIASVRKKCSLPIVLFGYFNPILSYGLERFAAQAAACGVDGLLVVDLPPEEAAELREFTDPTGLRFITLVAPTTDSRRMKTILRRAAGFVYYISVTGVTGTAVPKREDILTGIEKLRSVSPLPVVIGFGISTPEQAASFSGLADGVVVGSALVRLIEERGRCASLFAEVAEFAKNIRRAIDASAQAGNSSGGI